MNNQKLLAMTLMIMVSAKAMDSQPQGVGKSKFTSGFVGPEQFSEFSTKDDSQNAELPGMLAIQQRSSQAMIEAKDAEIAHLRKQLDEEKQDLEEKLQASKNEMKKLHESLNTERRWSCFSAQRLQAVHCAIDIDKLILKETFRAKVREIATLKKKFAEERDQHFQTIKDLKQELQDERYRSSKLMQGVRKRSKKNAELQSRRIGELEKERNRMSGEIKDLKEKLEESNNQVDDLKDISQKLKEYREKYRNILGAIVCLDKEKIGLFKRGAWNELCLEAKAQVEEQVEEQKAQNFTIEQAKNPAFVEKLEDRFGKGQNNRDTDYYDGTIQRTNCFAESTDSQCSMPGDPEAVTVQESLYKIEMTEDMANMVKLTDDEIQRIQNSPESLVQGDTGHQGDPDDDQASIQKKSELDNDQIIS